MSLKLKLILVTLSLVAFMSVFLADLSVQTDQQLQKVKPTSLLVKLDWLTYMVSMEIQLRDVYLKRLTKFDSDSSTNNTHR